MCLLLAELPLLVVQVHLPFKLMVGLGGLEPPTSRLSGVRSDQLSYKPISPAWVFSEGMQSPLKPLT